MGFPGRVRALNVEVGCASPDACHLHSPAMAVPQALTARGASELAERTHSSTCASHATAGKACRSHASIAKLRHYSKQVASQSNCDITGIRRLEWTCEPSATS